MAVACWPRRSFNPPAEIKQEGRGSYRPRPLRAISGPLGAWLRHDADIGPRRLKPWWPDLVGFLVADRSGNDHVFALFPVRGRCDAMLGGQLQGIDYTQHLVQVAARGHRVDQDQLDLLVRADDEDVADGLVVGRRTAFRGAAGTRRQHAVGLRNLQFGIADHRIVRRKADDLLDVDSPLLVVIDRIDRYADDLGVSLVEFRLEPGHGAELGSADRREVL